MWVECTNISLYTYTNILLKLEKKDLPNLFPPNFGLPIFKKKKRKYLPQKSRQAFKLKKKKFRLRNIQKQKKRAIISPKNYRQAFLNPKEKIFFLFSTDFRPASTRAKKKRAISSPPDSPLLNFFIAFNNPLSFWERIGTVRFLIILHSWIFF